ncbi:MAG TPA: ABC transporter permease, partial [Mobilitalea sp.]|nr:ABC transporter permease [Mobilitalea sp.]
SGIQDFEIAVVKEYDYAAEVQMFDDKLHDMNMEDTLDLPNVEELFFDDFLGNTQIADMLSYRIMDRETGEELLDKNEISAMVVLPKLFIYNTMMNFAFTRNVVSIEVLKNSNSTISADIAEQIMNQFANELNRMIIRRMTLQPYLMDLPSESLSDSSIEDLLFPTDIPSLTLNVKDVTGGDSWDSFQYYAIAMVSMFTLYAAGFGASALIEEKESFTLRRLKVTGKSLNDFVISNFCRVIIIAILQNVIMIAYSSLVLQVNFGNLSHLFIPILMSAVSVGCLGMLVSAITLASGSYSFANVFNYGIVNVMAMVGGSYVPVQILPEILQKAHPYSINGSSMNLYLNAISGKPLSSSTQYLVSLFIMDLLFAGSACIILGISNRKGGVHI